MSRAAQRALRPGSLRGPGGYAPRVWGLYCVGQCRSPQWRRRSGSVLGWTLWSCGGRLGKRGAKARDAGGRVAVPDTLRLVRLGTRGLAGWNAGSSARQVGGPDAAGQHLTARGALTASVPRGTDSDGVRLTAAWL